LKDPKLAGNFSVTDAGFVIIEIVSPAGQAEEEDVRFDYIE
jgi:hypothetical protein